MNHDKLFYREYADGQWHHKSTQASLLNQVRASLAPEWLEVVWFDIHSQTNSSSSDESISATVYCSHPRNEDYNIPVLRWESVWF